MIKFERSRDWARIGEIMRNPRLYDVSADDFAVARELFQPRQDEAIWYVLAWRDSQLLGLFALAPQNHITWEIHTRLLPAAWGAIAAEAAAAVVPWIWENTPCRRLVTFAPEYNRLAIRFARRGGMLEYGRNPESWLKGGRLFGQVLLGISKKLPL